MRGVRVAASAFRAEVAARGIWISPEFSVAWVTHKAIRFGEALGINPEHAIRYQWPAMDATRLMANELERLFDEGALARWQGPGERSGLPDVVADRHSLRS